MKLRKANIKESKEVFTVLETKIFSDFTDEDKIGLITEYFKDAIGTSTEEGEITKLDIRTIREEDSHSTLMKYALDIASSKRNLVAIRSLLRVGVGVDYSHLNFLLEREETDKTFMNKLRFHSDKTKEINELFNEDPKNNSWVEKIEEILNKIESNETTTETKEMLKELLSDVINSSDPMELQKSKAVPNFDQKQSETVSNLDQSQSEESILNFLKKNKTTPRINSLKERIDSIFTDHSSEVDQKVNKELENSIKGYIEKKEVKNLKDIFDYLCNNQELVAANNLDINWKNIFESAVQKYDPKILASCIDGRIKFEEVYLYIKEAELKVEKLEELEDFISKKTDFYDKLIERPTNNTQPTKYEEFDSLDGKTKVLERSDVIDQYELLSQIEKLHGEGVVKNLLSYLDSTKETPNASLSPARTKTEKSKTNQISNKLFFKRG